MPDTFDRDHDATASTVTQSQAAQTETLFLWFTAQSPRFHDRLARRFKEKHGWDTVLICNARQDLPGPDHFDSEAFVDIIDMEPVLAPTPREALPPIETLVRDFEEIERRLNLNFNEIMRSDRFLGRSFVTGAWYARSLYGLSADYEQTMEIVLRLAQFFEEKMKRWRPRAVIAPSASLATTTLLQVAHGCGTPWRGFVQSRISTRFFWSDTVDCLPLDFHTALDERLARPADRGAPVSLDAPTPAKAYFSGMWAQAGLRGLLRGWYGTLRHKLPHRLRPGRRNYGNYLILDEMWAIARRAWRLRRGLRQEGIDPPLQAGQPYILFPLQVEPESSLMAEAPMAANQLAVIDLLARTVPAGWRLVVKEHPAALGIRPRGFDRQIRAYPNANFAAAQSDVDKLADGARCVAVINGTVGVQAAVRGIPVITFHPNYIARHLPHVQFADSYDSLRSAMCRLRDDELPDYEARVAAGNAIHQTMVDLSFEINDPRLVLNDKSLAPPSDATLDRIIDDLLASLEQPRRQ